MTTPIVVDSTPSTMMIARLVCTPRIVWANMSLPTSLSTPNGWSPSMIPAPPSHVGRNDSVGPPSPSTSGTNSL